MLGGFGTNFGQEGFGDRGQEAHQIVSGLASLFRLGAFNQITLYGQPIHQSTAAFSKGLLGQQHVTDSRMHNNRVCFFFRRLGARERAHSQTILGIGQSTLEGAFSGAYALQSRADTSRVHESEHAVQALVWRANQEALGAIEIHYTSGRSLDAHFVFNGATGQSIALASRAIGCRQELRHNKQGNTLGALRCIW